MKLDAILWDYDDTLVNSMPKNIDITKNILAEVAPHLTGDNLPRYLRSEADYHYANHAAKNWQALYVDYYGLSLAEMLQAGSLWAKHQEMNRTAVHFLTGLPNSLPPSRPFHTVSVRKTRSAIFARCWHSMASMSGSTR